MKEFYVYILTNSAGLLYIGVTSDLDGRFWEHTVDRRPGFAARHNLDRLIFFAHYPDARQAIAREKQLKGWRRSKKSRSSSR